MAIVEVLPDLFAADAAAELFGALADRSRLLILCELGRGSRRVGELVPRLGLAQSSVSGHLAVLKRAGLVNVERQGNHRVYSLARPELLDLMAALQPMLHPRPGLAPAPTPYCDGQTAA